MSARQAGRIRRGCRHRSGNRQGLGVGEFFTAPDHHAAAILAAWEDRFKRYLLGFAIDR
jgi:hypothetical protein